MKDLYIQAEEQYLNEVHDAVQAASDLMDNVMSESDLDKVKECLIDAIKLIDEGACLSDRVGDLMGEAADRAVDAAKDPY